MSRIGNNPITIPEGVKVNVDGRNIEVSGKNGAHTHYLHKNIKIKYLNFIICFYFE